MTASNQNKGLKTEELLRNYFLELGFFVVRGILFKYNNTHLTDLDLVLFNRPSTLTRERINVDIKDKQRPQATERILWAKGVQIILGFDKCIVATSDKREILREIGYNSDVTILDGSFLKKIKSKTKEDRLTEEEFTAEIMKNSLGKLEGDWLSEIEEQKGSLIHKMSFGSIINTLEIIKKYFEISISNVQRREGATRVLFLMISFFLLKLDILIKDFVFLEVKERQKILEEGFKYGNIGKEGLKKTLNLAKELAGEAKNSINEKEIFNEYESIPVKILAEYFNKGEVVKHLFSRARYCEQIAFNKTFIKPVDLPPEIKGIIGVLLDFMEINRTKYFGVY